MDKKNYPANWQEIASAIKEWAEWNCENCGHPHDVAGGYVLTVHHIDGDTTNNNFNNLVALCQRCHLHIQAKYTPGQLSLFEAPPQWAAVRGLAGQYETGQIYLAIPSYYPYQESIDRYKTRIGGIPRAAFYLGGDLWLGPVPEEPNRMPPEAPERPIVRQI